MKPPEKYIKWLQAHPAVWEALQEDHEWSDGDWGYDTDNGELYLMSQETGTLIVLGTMAGVVKWIPHLGQLVRMVYEIVEAKTKTNEAYTGHAYFSRTTREERGWGGEAWDGKAGYGVNYSLEPEIACTALWAKVKGVE